MKIDVREGLKIKEFPLCDFLFASIDLVENSLSYSYVTATNGFSYQSD